MRLQKTKADEYKGTTYWKYVVILPEKLIQEMGWDGGMELDYTIQKSKDCVLLRRKI